MPSDTSDLYNLKNDSFWKGACNNGKFYNPEEYGLKTLFQSPLPEIETIPKPLRKLIESTEDLSTFEKASVIHNFVNTNMKYPEEDDKIYGEKDPSIKELIENWRYGDCDNKARLSGVLLRYAGVDESNLSFVNAITSRGNEEDREIAMGVHSVLVLKNEDQHYLMDMRFKEIVPLEESGDGIYRAEGTLVSKNMENTLEGYVTLDPILIVPMESGASTYIGQETFDIQANINAQQNTPSPANKL